MFIEKTLNFQGSKERLSRMVARYDGNFMEDQRFVLRWRPSRYKELHRLTFCIHCHYERTERGYRITYRIWPTWFSAIRMVTTILFWIWVIWAVYTPGEFVGVVAAVVLSVINIVLEFQQMAVSEKEFFNRFTTGTK